MRKTILFVAIIPIIIITMWFRDVVADRQYKLSIIEPTPLLSISPLDYPESNPSTLILQPGEKIKVLRMRYGKDFQTFKVETTSGNIGWVIYGSNIHVNTN